MLSLAFFYFVFLGTEYLFDNRMAVCTDPAGVALAQSYILGVSVLGLLSYSLIEKRKGKYENPAAFKAGGFLVLLLSIGGYGVLLDWTEYGVLLGAGVYLFLVLGYLGSRAHYRAAQQLFNSKHPAKTVGAAYAFGLLLQFLNHNLFWSEKVEGVILAVSFVVLWVLTVGMAQNALSGYHRRQKAEDGEMMSVKNAQEGVTAEQISWKNPRLAGVALLVTVVLMTCIFATLDNAVTLAHAAGTMDIGQWPRLFLALSGLLAGVLFDLHSGRYRSLIMYAVTILSTICVLIIESGGPFLPGLLIFYVSVGFFVVFFTNGFFQLSYRMQDGKMWAGMGRAANNLGAVITGVASISLLTGDSHVLTAVLALVLFVLISMSLLWYYDCMQIVFGKSESGVTAGMTGGVVTGRKLCPEADNTGSAGQPDGESGSEVLKEMESCEMPDSQSRMLRFAEHFGLTEREQEVLQLLLLSDDSMQEIAESLFVSRAMLYRHVAALNEKTGTRSRIGLIQFYYNWEEDQK